jgi:hypothetical protein
VDITVITLMVSNANPPRNINVSEMNPLNPGSPIAAKNAYVVKAV